MKKLILFALLASVPTFGQAYSNSALQNSPGNYSRVVPFAQITVCFANDTAVPCTQRATTYVDDSLTTQCGQKAASGVLTGNPAWGPNCNNPGLADAFGNFTIYVVNGNYRLCVYAQAWACQEISVGGNGGSAVLPCPNNLVSGAIGASTGAGGFNCDQKFTTDFQGNWISQSGRTIGPVNGFLGLTGGGASPGSDIKYKLGLNEFRFLGTTLGTPYYLVPPPTLGTVGQVIGKVSQSTDANGDPVVVTQWQNSGSGVQAQVGGVDLANCVAGLCPLINFVAGTNITITNTSNGNVRIAAGAGTEVQVNGVDTTAQTPINFQDTSSVTFANPSVGVITATATAAAPPRMGTPVAPTLTTNGTPGAASVTYLVQGCQDGPICADHTLTASATIATANATLSPTNSINIKTYGNTLYGPRCYNIYRTAGGPSQGKIATCAGKALIDNGLVADGTTATNTNTTVLDPNGLTAPLPGCNKIPAAPWGVDGPPCTPNAMDDEFTHTFGALADANDGQWTFLNQGNLAATLTNGMLSLASPSGAGNALNCVIQPLPTAPYTLVTLFYANTAANSNNTRRTAVGFYESGSGKLLVFSSVLTMDMRISRWTNATTFSADVTASNVPQMNYPISVRLSRAVNNISIAHSLDGVVYANDDTETVTTWFTTAPDNVALCIQPNSGFTDSIDFDYFRRTQ